MFIVMGKIVIRHFQIYHHSIFCPSKILHKLFFFNLSTVPREMKVAYGDEQRVCINLEYLETLN